MSTGDPQPQTIASAEYNTGYIAGGNLTATGPYMGSVTWGGSSDTTVSWEPPSTIQFPAEVKMEKWKIAPEVESTDKSLRKMRESLGRQWAEQINDAILYGIEPRKKEKEMPKNEERTLYYVFVIDPNGDGEVVATLKNVVAKNPTAAEKKAVFELASNPKTAENLMKDLEDYDFLVEDVADFGSIRAKKDK